MAENTVLEFRIDELSVQSAWLKTLYDLADELNCKCQTFLKKNTVLQENVLRKQGL